MKNGSEAAKDNSQVKGIEKTAPTINDPHQRPVAPLGVSLSDCDALVSFVKGSFMFAEFFSQDEGIISSVEDEVVSTFSLLLVVFVVSGKGYPFSTIMGVIPGAIPIQRVKLQIPGHVFTNFDGYEVIMQ